ncbi:MOSC N-terminal beta barrel domain-containing protein [Paraflavisolibacter sp. H34]|uniref:MOSC domain-containing protein n=1 Tax=Huijunlia imazamoxiresistens TaxID=3127457 RepID=UPI003018AB51
MLHVSQLFIYPVKSLGGISLPSAQVTDRGLQYDRRWMLVDGDGHFMTQRTLPQMALLQPELTESGLRVVHKKNGNTLEVPFAPAGDFFQVKVWSNRCRAQEVSREAGQWFSDMLGVASRLVYMPDTTRRRVDGRYTRGGQITAFSDGYPLLLIGQSSLDDVNARLAAALPMNRFRPNLVVAGGLPFEEDGWAEFSISGIPFSGVKLCARCVVTTINQDEATKAKEPLKTLSTYRMRNNKIYFGQNVVHGGEGLIRLGDAVEVTRRKPLKNFNPIS